MCPWIERPTLNCRAYAIAIKDTRRLGNAGKSATPRERGFVANRTRPTFPETMKRFFTTRPARLTATLAVIAVVFVIVSFVVPGTPAHHFRVDGHRVSETPLGWQEVVIGAPRVGGVVVAIVALLRHQRRVETIDDIVREDRATIPYDRSAVA
jgi:hypothetical protein